MDNVPVTRREKVVEEAEEFINRTLNRFKPFKILGHLGIGNSSSKGTGEQTK